MWRLCFILALVGVAEAAPLKTLHFPGSGTTTFVTDGRVLYAGTGWTRENGASVFDVSDPSAMRYVADVRARGYTTCPPVLVGTRVYQPLWFGAMRVNLADPRNPEVEGLMDFDFPRHTCDSLVREGDELRFVTREGVRVYDVSDPSRPAAFSRALPPPAPAARPKPDPRLKLLPKSVRVAQAQIVGDTALVYDRQRSSYRIFRLGETNATELCERFMLHSLSSLAVVGDTAYVHAATQPMTHGVWTLDLRREGYVDFGPHAVFRAAPPRGTDAFTMLMQSVGAIVDLGNGWLLADDGAVRHGGDETTPCEFVGERELPVCNHAVEGRRVLMAQSRQVKLVDVTNPAAIRTVARWQADELTHATGVALSGDDLWAVTQERLAKQKGFLTYVPPKSTLRRFRVDGTNLVEVASLELPPSVSCAAVADGVIYVSGIARRTPEGPVAAMLSIVDGRAMKLLASRTDLCGTVYKIKRFGTRVFVSDAGIGIRELDVSDVRNPRRKGLWRRSAGSNPSYDDFTVSDGRLYALAHSSLDVYDLAASETSDDLTSPRFARNFGALEKMRLALKDGYEAVAFGEGGLVIEKNGRYVAELPADAAGNCAICADDIAFKDGLLVVTDKAENRVGLVDVGDPRKPRLVSVR